MTETKKKMRMSDLLSGLGEELTKEDPLPIEPEMEEEPVLKKENIQRSSPISPKTQNPTSSTSIKKSEAPKVSPEIIKAMKELEDKNEALEKELNRKVYKEQIEDNGEFRIQLLIIMQRIEESLSSINTRILDTNKLLAQANDIDTEEEENEDDEE